MHIYLVFALLRDETVSSFQLKPSRPRRGVIKGIRKPFNVAYSAMLYFYGRIKGAQTRNAARRPFWQPLLYAILHSFVQNEVVFDPLVDSATTQNGEVLYGSINRFSMETLGVWPTLAFYFLLHKSRALVAKISSFFNVTLHRFQIQFGPESVCIQARIFP